MQRAGQILCCVPHMTARRRFTKQPARWINLNRQAAMGHGVSNHQQATRSCCMMQLAHWVTLHIQAAMGRGVSNHQRGNKELLYDAACALGHSAQTSSNGAQCKLLSAWQQGAAASGNASWYCCQHGLPTFLHMAAGNCLAKQSVPGVSSGGIDKRQPVLFCSMA
eukprot:1140355-Pelagomonas_calceolata.AAC.6